MFNLDFNIDLLIISSNYMQNMDKKEAAADWWIINGWKILLTKLWNFPVKSVQVGYSMILFLIQVNNINLILVPNFSH